MSWTDFVTQYFGQNGEEGTDFGVPFHTPIPAVLAGVVQRINCAVGYRCEVDIAASYGGRSVTESYLHIDQPAVTVGERLAPGDLVGLSGGQLSGGSNPDSPQYSTGPHVEFDVFQGGAWQNPIDPLSIARGGPAGVSGIGTGGPDPSQLLNLVPGLANLLKLQNAGAQVPALADPLGLNSAVSTAGHGLADALGVGVHDVQTFAQRQVIALGVAAVVLVVLFDR